MPRLNSTSSRAISLPGNCAASCSLPLRTESCRTASNRVPVYQAPALPAPTNNTSVPAAIPALFIVLSLHVNGIDSPLRRTAQICHRPRQIALLSRSWLSSFAALAQGLLPKETHVLSHRRQRLMRHRVQPDRRVPGRAGRQLVLGTAPHRLGRGAVPAAAASGAVAPRRGCRPARRGRTAVRPDLSLPVPVLRLAHGTRG